MKTLAELKQENEQLKKQVQDLKFIADAWQTEVKNLHITVRHYQTALGVRTLRVV
jgi:FtsZ-binding cell division protein ZapB